MTWLSNLQQSRPNPSGSGPNDDRAAFVPASNAADFKLGHGYAGADGNSNQPDSLKLVRHTGGLIGPAALRTQSAVSAPVTAGALTGLAH